MIMMMNIYILLWGENIQESEDVRVDGSGWVVGRYMVYMCYI